ncbi:SDR family NAD(P)-dependent oxidoreductase [Paenibacillus paridis]|uniref:SDR family NAD(P)-dependent oxidoreductase n=1 Tax=Paenibacillus paridis TaxID=2583376 RepID=UPI0013917600|nr:SDR family NAD(P)-dependent oxidoreductase [Paenibacillus paridis]
MNDNSNARRPVAVLTASYSSIGTELSKQLASAGYDLVVINRSIDRTNQQLIDLKAFVPSVSVQSIQADLSNHRDIRRVAEQVARIHDFIDLLIHNAGVATDRLELSVQGNDLHYEVNTFAPYLLTKLLRPQLASANNAVVVAVGSSGMRMARQFDPKGLRKPHKFRRFQPYAHTKLATAAVFHAMAADYAKDGIALRIADPGPTHTPMSLSGAMPIWFRLVRWYFVPPEKGAKRIFEAATAPTDDGRSELYFEFGRTAALPRVARDTAVQQQLLAILRGMADS